MTDVINISTEEETKQLAKKFAKTLKMGDIVLLYGTLVIFAFAFCIVETFILWNFKQRRA